MEEKTQKLYTQKEIAKKAGTSKDRISRWIRTKGIKGTPKGSALLYPEKILEAYKKHVAGSKSPVVVPTKENLYKSMITKQDKTYTERLKEKDEQIGALQEQIESLMEQNSKLTDALAKAQKEPDYEKLGTVLSESIKPLAESKKHWWQK